MEARTIIAVTGNGLGRATAGADGRWAVDFPLAGQDVRCLAADPRSPRRLFAGAQADGVLRSHDGGDTWQPCGMAGQTVKALAVSPHDPNLIFAGVRPAYLFASRDGGESWQELAGFRRIRSRWWWFSPAEKPWQAYVQAIALSPTQPDVLLAGIEFGAVVLSEDGGQTWSAHRRGALRDCHALKFHARDGDWVYEAGGSGGGASVSGDGGRTWRKAKAGLARNYGVACAADPEQPQIWYVSVAPNPAKAYVEQAEAYLYRASSEGEWQPIGWAPHPMQDMPMDLVTDPAAPGHLYAGVVNGDVWHSSDYGDTWQRLPFNFEGVWRSLLVLPHQDHSRAA